MFQLRTAHATTLSARDNRLGHGEITASTPSILVSPAAGSTDGVYLASGDGKVFRITADGELRHVHPFRIVSVPQEGLQEGFCLRHPQTGCYLSCDPGGAVAVDREHPDAWERLSFQSVDLDPPARDLLHLLKESNDTLLDIIGCDPSAISIDILHARLLLVSDLEFRQLLRSISSRQSLHAVYFELFRKTLQDRHGSSGRSFHVNYAWGHGDFVSAGRHSYGSPRILPYPPAKLTIGAFCSIADNVTIILGNHLTRAATTFPFQAESSRWPCRHAAIGPVVDDVPASVVIGNDVWIGLGVTILPGTVIGHGCIIAAGSIVRGTVPSYSLYGGNPGRVIRLRFDEMTIRRLLALRWWDWPEHKIDLYSGLMLGDVALFLDAAESEMPPDLLMFGSIEGPVDQNPREATEHDLSVITPRPSHALAYGSSSQTMSSSPR